MTTKLFIIRRRDNSEVERLIEAKTRGRVENLILEDYDVSAVKGTNAAEALALQAKGIKVEKVED